MNLLKFLFLCSSILILSACDSGSDNNVGTGGDNRGPYVNWSSIPPEFNPETQTIEFEIRDFTRIETNLFGFQKDFKVVLSDSLPKHLGTIQLFTVRSNDAKTSLSGLSFHDGGDTLRIGKSGNFECSINVKNQHISGLAGACYVRVVLTLPATVEIEAYNTGTLHTKRYFPMTNEQLIDGVEDAISSDDKLSVLQSYLQSYRDTSKTPKLNSGELKEIIKRFSYKDGKFEALGQLHLYVTDRQNLNQVIKDTFAYFDQDDARRIVGIS